jgi:tetratricopeptide (TPR) repeat protein
MSEGLAELGDCIANPFPGLRPFETRESYLFFGREGQSEELLHRLRQSRLLALVGTSGSGKSSLVRAGLVPSLHGGLLPNAGSQWRVGIFRPGENPIRSLAQALHASDVIGRANPSEEQTDRDLTLLEVRLRRSGLGLIEVVRLARLPAGQNLLIVIDQFEELFRFTGAAGQPGDDAAFVKLILEATRQTEEPIYIALTMRSDFIGDCSQFRDLPEAVAAGLYLIPRLTRDQQRAVIEEPVRVAGGTISRRLVNRLLNDAGDDPDQLPILQHALMRAWDHWRASRRDGRPIDLEDYNEIGGMAEALSIHADEAYGNLDEKGQDITKRMFQCLTEKGGDNREVRRAMHVGAIAEVVGAPVSEVISVIEEFRKPGRSFLTPPAGVPLDQNTLIDISHESLIRNWARLADWVEDEAETAKDYRRLAETAVLHEQGKADLWSDTDLAAYQVWSEPSKAWADRYHTGLEAAKSFLAASRAAREALRRSNRRRRTYLWSGALSVIVLLAVAAGYARSQKNDAQTKEHEAIEARNDAQRKEHEAIEARGYAIQAAATLGKAAAVSGSEIEAVMQNADRMLAQIAGSSADPNVVTEQAALLLSFAASSEMLGNYDKQRDRIETARQLLDRICGVNAGTDHACRDLLAKTFEAQGDYLLLDAGQPEKAIDAYKQAIRLREQIEPGKTAEPDPTLTLAMTHASLSRALVAANKYTDALAAAQNCRAAVITSGVKDDAVKALTASCDLAEAQAQRSLGRFDRAIARAKAAVDGFGELVGKKPEQVGSISYVIQNARAAHELARALWSNNQKDEAAARLKAAEQSLTRIVQDNPQNDRVASLLSELLGRAGKFYDRMNRDDLAAAVLEQRVDLARARSDGPRGHYWRNIEIESLEDLASSYSALERHEDAARAIEKMLALKILPGASGELYSADVLQSYLTAGEEWLEDRKGENAFKDFQVALTQAERQVAKLGSEGQQRQNGYVAWNKIVYDAIEDESAITAQMLPAETRLQILTTITNDVSRHVLSDPRVITFKRDQGFSLYQLALAKELAGDVVDARRTHQDASDAGWRASTVVLAHLYYEGAAGVPRDRWRAREFEARAATQGAELRIHSEDVVYANGKKDPLDLYFRSPAGNVDPMEDEYYRLEKYLGAHLTDSARHDVEAIYARASNERRSVASVIDDLEASSRSGPDTTKTVVSDIIATARNQLQSKNVENAIHSASDAVAHLMSLDLGHHSELLPAWDQVAGVALDIDAAAQHEKKDDIVKQARSITDKAIGSIQSIEVQGSSPKLRLAANLERLARQAGQTHHFDYLIMLLQRAIEVRDQVRISDRENAQCDCHVASDYRVIGIIQQEQGKLDDALIAFERAAIIYEDLAHQSPRQQWDGALLATYGDLAELFGEKRKEPFSALLYAQKVADIRKSYAGLQSSDSQARVNYALSLETVSNYAWSSAVASRKDDPNTAERYFQRAVESRKMANAVRGAVLAVDPKNAECSCRLDSNLAKLVEFYVSWGRSADARALVDRNLTAARQAVAGVAAGTPEYEMSQSDLAVALRGSAGALRGFKHTDYALIDRDLEEAASLLRPLVKELPDATDTLSSVLRPLSFNDLLLGRYQQALAAADEGLAGTPNNSLLIMNKAHALMLLGRTEEARRLYLNNVEKELADYIREDFRQLKAAGRINPLMAEVEKTFANHAKIAVKT